MEEQAKYNINTTMGEMEEYKNIILCELSKPKKKESVLEEAQKILHGDRDADYGDPVENFKRISRIASAILDKEITDEECCVVMLAVKLARENYRHKRDNIVDGVAYMEILSRIKENNIKV